MHIWVCMLVTQAGLWCGPVLRRQMLCHMSSLLDSMKGARLTPLHPAATYSVKRVPRRAGEAVVRPTQPSPPYGHLRAAPWLHSDRDVKCVRAIGYTCLRGRAGSSQPAEICAKQKMKWGWKNHLPLVIWKPQHKYSCDPWVSMHDRGVWDLGNGD